MQNLHLLFTSPYNSAHYENFFNYEGLMTNAFQKFAIGLTAALSAALSTGAAMADPLQERLNDPRLNHPTLHEKYESKYGSHPDTRTLRQKCEEAIKTRATIAHPFLLSGTGFIEGKDYACNVTLKHRSVIKTYNLKTSDGASAYNDAVNEAIIIENRLYENRYGNQNRYNAK